VTRDAVDDAEAEVVPRSFVVSTGIAEAGDDPCAAAGSATPAL
jgi:hypothetical protein